jgi:hypothetical protein
MGLIDVSTIRTPRVIMLRSIFLIAILVLALSSAQARNLSITFDKPSVAVGEQVTITVSSVSPLGYCGIHVNYRGTDEKPTLFRVGTGYETLPYKVVKTFSTPGVVEVQVEGKRVNSALGCPGSTEAKLTVTGSAVAGVDPRAAMGGDLERRASSGDLEAAFQLGTLISSKGDDASAYKWFEFAGSKGHPSAMNAAGYLLENGRGVSQDYAAAQQWYLYATKRGNADAMVSRGVLLSAGLGSQKDPQQAYISFVLGATFATSKELREEATKLRDEVGKTLNAPQLRNSQAEAGRMTADIKAGKV